jgi:transcriptional regulator GlxA family with amidase domain
MFEMPRVVAILAPPGAQLLDISGPLDVFAQANVEAAKEIYALRIVACEPGVIRCSSGARLIPDYAVGDVVVERIDTLLVAGAPNAAQMLMKPALRSWLLGAARNARRYGSVCTGAFPLAATGLLDGRRVTTHWAAAAQLSQAYPRVNIDKDALYVRDGKLRTAAGVTAGLDLALSLVEEDLGREIAMRVAEQLVMFFKRPGGQLQFSRKGEIRPAGRSVLQEIQRWIAANPALGHSVEKLAARASLSPRHFARLFHSEVGVTPAVWVEEARVTAARALLERGYDAPKQVALKCGFASADTLRRAFVKHIGVTPAEYRKSYVRETRP